MSADIRIGRGVLQEQVSDFGANIEPFLTVQEIKFTLPLQGYRGAEEIRAAARLR